MLLLKPETNITESIQIMDRALELADKWHKNNPNWSDKELWAWGDKAATMLRQQQAEIEELKAQSPP